MKTRVTFTMSFVKEPSNERDNGGRRTETVRRCQKELNKKKVLKEATDGQNRVKV